MLHTLLKIIVEHSYDCNPIYIKAARDHLRIQYVCVHNDVVNQINLGQLIWAKDPDVKVYLFKWSESESTSR